MVLAKDWKYRNMLRWASHREPPPTKREIKSHIRNVYRKDEVSAAMVLAWTEEISAAVEGRSPGPEQRVD